MRAALISSSVLILALTALRFLFREKISRRLQYALWGLVLLRLLLPVSLPASSFSVMTGAERITVRQTTGREVPLLPPGTIAPATVPAQVLDMGASMPVPEPSHTWDAVYPETVDVPRLVWLAGAASLAACFLWTNLRFAKKLRQSRTPYDAPGFPLPVYISAVPASPCLFGLFRPTVYLTPRAAEAADPAHILTHELCHYRHGDHIWAALRALVLAVYWFDPLVWLAAWLSKADGEQACDEAAIRALGEDNRLAYGRTLVDMIALRPTPSGMFCAATTMVSGKRGLKKRLERIVHSPKLVAWAVVLMVLAAGVLTACTFTAAREEKPAAQPAPEEKNTIEYAETPVETRESMYDYDVYSFLYDVDDSFRGMAVWVEDWQNGYCQSVSSAGAHELLSGGNERMEVGINDKGKENRNPASVDFLLGFHNGKDGSQTLSSIPVSLAGYEACAIAVLGRGSENGWDVAAEEPILLVCMAPHNGEEVRSYDPEYLMENPKAVAQYERAVLIKCAFTKGDPKDYAFPTPAAEDMAEKSYAVSLLQDGAETAMEGFDLELAGEIVLHSIQMNAAWPADGLRESRPYVFRIRETRTAGGESKTYDHYAYRLDNGRAVLESGSVYTGLWEDDMIALEAAAGVGEGEVFDLEAAVSRAILAQCGGECATESHVTLKTSEEGELVTVYCMAMPNTFDLEDGRLVVTSGSHAPVALTFFQSPNGAYRLTEYWRPEDGDGYPASIREKFPADIAEEAMDTQKYVMAQTQNCYAQAIAHFGLDLTEEIAETVDLLCRTPGWEKPSPYVEPGYLDYRQLLYYGDETLRYVFGEFLKGDQTDPRGEVLWKLTTALCREETMMASVYVDGQTMFNEWKDYNLMLFERNPLDWYRENCPKGYMLLSMMGKTDPAAP